MPIPSLETRYPTRYPPSIPHKGHMVFMELTFLYLGIELMLTQDFQNAANVRNVFSERFGEDDDIVKNSHCDQVQVLL